MKVTVTEEIFVARPPEVVWDFTQDSARRTEWDRSILAAQILERGPPPRVRVRCTGGVRGELRYKLFERPSRTSVALADVESALIAGGGGSWSYEPSGAGTRWTQTNSLVFKGRVAHRLLGALVKWNLARSTRRAMRAAKRRIEAIEPAG